MKQYKIIGLNNAEQAERIRLRFCEILGAANDWELDAETASILLPDNIDARTISLISSFEQVSIVTEDKHHSHDHDHEHDHSHGHGHSHSHEIDFSAGATVERNMLFVFVMNFTFAIAEFIMGTLFNSQAILSDAIHDLGDALSIGLAWIFQKISRRRASDNYSYGYRRFSLLGALVTSIVLIIGSLGIIRETVPRLMNPEPINQVGVFWMAIAAIAINAFSVRLLSTGSSANEKLLNIHLIEDLLGWIAVLVMSIILRFTDWYILDPILSLLIAAWILYNTIPQFIKIVRIFLQAVPADVDVQKLSDTIESIDGVHAISHFHIWSTDGNQHMMTISVATASASMSDQERIKSAIRLAALKYNIYHVTVEMLYDPEKLITESISCDG